MVTIFKYLKIMIFLIENWILKIIFLHVNIILYFNFFYNFALKCLWISFKDVEFWLLYKVSVFFQIMTAWAATFRSTMNSFGKTFTIKFQTFRFWAIAFGTITLRICISYQMVLRYKRHSFDYMFIDRWLIWKFYLVLIHYLLIWIWMFKEIILLRWKVMIRINTNVFSNLAFIVNLLTYMSIIIFLINVWIILWWNSLNVFLLLYVFVNIKIIFLCINWRDLYIF